jgi:hypothetical protein
VQSYFEIKTREDGAVEVVVRPSGARPFRLVGFASERSAEEWVRTRVACEDRRLSSPPPNVDESTGPEPSLH